MRCSFIPTSFCCLVALGAALFFAQPSYASIRGARGGGASAICELLVTAEPLGNQEYEKDQLRGLRVMSEDAREAHRARVTSWGSLDADPSRGDMREGGGRAWNFVLGLDGELYVSSRDVHHSEFFGTEVLFAGELITDETGRIVGVSGKSGHYLPDLLRVRLFVELLVFRGVPAESLVVGLAGHESSRWSGNLSLSAPDFLRTVELLARESQRPPTVEQLLSRFSEASEEVLDDASLLHLAGYHPSLLQAASRVPFRGYDNAIRVVRRRAEHDAVFRANLVSTLVAQRSTSIASLRSDAIDRLLRRLFEIGSAEERLVVATVMLERSQEGLVRVGAQLSRTLYGYLSGYGLSSDRHQIERGRIQEALLGGDEEFRQASLRSVIEDLDRADRPNQQQSAVGLLGRRSAFEPEVVEHLIGFVRAGRRLRNDALRALIEILSRSRDSRHSGLYREAVREIRTSLSSQLRNYSSPPAALEQQLRQVVELE